jgi:hypothetical protein
MLSAGAYLLGTFELALVLAGALAAGDALRRRLLPCFSGPPGWLATAVLALATLIWAGELLGTFGLFDEVPYVIVVAAAGLGLRLALRPAADDRRPALPAPRPPTAMTVAGLAVAGVVIAHFSIGTRISLGSGMTGFDTTWYHGPFAAGFASSGSTLDLQLIAPQYLAWFYPQNSELLHAPGILAFGRDILSPFFSLGWLAGCLAAAWCIGRPFGAGPASLAGAALVLGSGALADQSGEARNDIPAIFFLLAAAAIVVNAWAARSRDEGLPLGAVAAVGIAAGLAAGTKVNYLAPAAAFAIGLALLAPPGRRARSFGVAAGAAFAAGGYWYVRNLVHAGNPLPWLKGIVLPAPDQPLGGREEHGITDYLLDFGVWGDWFGPGLRDGLGLLWPLLLLAGLAGIGLCLVRRAEPSLRLLAAVALAAVAAWLVAPASAEGPEGSPVGFVSGLRYLAPALALALALLPLAPALRGQRARRLVLGAYVVALPFVDASSEPWPSEYVAAAILAGIAAAGVGAVLAFPRLRPASRPLAFAGTVLLVVAAVAGGNRVQRSYLENRYAEPTFTTPGLDAAFAWARDLEDTAIGTTTTRQYPFWGTDLSNRVRFVGVERPHGGFVRPPRCAAFRRAVNEIEPRYLVVSLDRAEPGRAFPAEAAWVEGDDAATVVLRRSPAVVFELDGPLDPRACPSR